MKPLAQIRTFSRIHKMISFILFTALLGSCVQMPKKPALEPFLSQQLPNTAAFNRASELLSLINEGNKDKIAGYLALNAIASLHDYADFLAMVHRDTRKLYIEKIESASENAAKLLIKSEITGLPMDFSMVVDEKPPHLITAIHLDFLDESIKDGNEISHEQTNKELQEFFHKVCQADMFSGAMLFAQGDDIIFQGACGEANKDFGAKNTIDTKFNLGSMNKMFTAVAIAQLIEQGKLSLDDELAKFMPEFPNRQLARQINVRHLLSHTSGLGSYFNGKYNATPKDKLKTIDDFLGLVKGEGIDFSPGTKWQYSNTGFLVLGKIIELITGGSYFDYVDKNIYRPAGMLHSGSFDLTRVNSNLAVGYNKENDDQVSNNLYNHVVKGGPAGGGYSTVGDLFKFSQALQNDRLIKTHALLMLTTPGTLNASYGFGFDVRETSAGKSFGHGGGFIGISSDLTIFSQKHITAVVLSNYSMGSMVVAMKMRQMAARLGPKNLPGTR